MVKSITWSHSKNQYGHVSHSQTLWVDDGGLEDEVIFIIRGGTKGEGGYLKRHYISIDIDLIDFAAIKFRL